jgi:hypothetical protein
MDIAYRRRNSPQVHVDNGGAARGCRQPAINSSHTPPAPPHPRTGRPPHLCFLVGTVGGQHLAVEAYHRPTHTHPSRSAADALPAGKYHCLQAETVSTAIDLDHDSCISPCHRKIHLLGMLCIKVPEKKKVQSIYKIILFKNMHFLVFLTVQVSVPLITRSLCYWMEVISQGKGKVLNLRLVGFQNKYNSWR